MLAVSDNWRITDMAAHTNVLTTHPYPPWTAHSAQAEISSQQILLNATCQTKFNTDLGKKPCLVEEIGTMGPMVCDNETAIDGCIYGDIKTVKPCEMTLIKISRKK